jgi:hypothetical protein
VPCLRLRAATLHRHRIQDMTSRQSVEASLRWRRGLVGMERTAIPAAARASSALPSSDVQHLSPIGWLVSRTKVAYSPRIIAYRHGLPIVTSVPAMPPQFLAPLGSHDYRRRSESQTHRDTRRHGPQAARTPLFWAVSPWRQAASSAPRSEPVLDRHRTYPCSGR